MENFPLGVIGKMQIPAADVPLGAGDGALRRLREIQQAEDLVAGGHAVHGDVEIGPQKPHGQEKVRRQEEDEQTPRKVGPPRPKLAHRQDDPQRRPAIGDEIHDGDGIELHGQDLHGDAAEALGLFVHLPVFGLVGLINFQGGQTLEIFQEAVP